MILSMGFPNILGLFILAPEVRRDLKDYWHKLKTGEIKRFK
jgi:AGCS family alanine or glycine:cation symporter